MAEVISERCSRNGELKADNDEIKVNGDKCDGTIEPEESGFDDSVNDACFNKKVIIDINTIDKLHDHKDRSLGTIANGHLKLADSSDTKSKSLCSNSASNDLIVTESSVSSTVPMVPSSNEQNEDLSAELENDEEEEEEVEEDEEEDVDDEDDVEANCDSSPINFAQNKRVDENDDVLNLKAISSSSADSNSHDKHELQKTTTDDKTESISVTASSEDGSQKPEADHNDVDNSSSDLSKSVDDLENDSSMSENSSDKRKNKNKPPQATNIVPRRSSRNLNKLRNYSEKELAEFDANASCNSTSTPTPKSKTNEEDEIEEVTLTDPLAEDPNSRMRSNKTIVVSDTKGLVEFASSAKMPRSNKKEPTLVIIDTNSILSGRGAVPISQSSNSSSLHSSSVSTTIPVSLPIPAGTLASATRGVPSSTSAFSVIPIGISSQGMYSHYKNPPPQMKPIVVGPASTTVTPITIQSVSSSMSHSNNHSSGVVVQGGGGLPSQQSNSNSSSKQPPIILPSLTDDMFVVEAPSFIVPYVYEKPPMKSLKDYIEKLGAEVRQAEEKERQQREEQEKLEKEERDKAEKERVEAEEKKKNETDQEEDQASADGGDRDASVKDENMEVDDDKSDKTADKPTSESNADASSSKDETNEKDTILQMEVDEEVDPDAPKVTSENDIVLASSIKAADSTTTKKDETETDAAAVTAAPKDEKKVEDIKKQPISYFDNPLGKFFMQIGLNLVQEHVQTDLLRSQRRKHAKEGDKCTPDIKLAIETLSKTLESSKENNDPFKLELRKCELCSFKTESILVMAHHLETPHMKNYTYRCNFCPFEVRSPHDILFHMESEHNIRGRLERAPAFHQCANCPFEDNQKGKLTRHIVSCSKKYRPERNQEPPLDWEPPAKIPRVTRNRPPSMSPGNAVYQAAMSGLKQVPQNTLLPKLMPNTAPNMKQLPNMINVNKRPNAVPPNFSHRFPNAGNQPNFQQRQISMPGTNQSVIYRSPQTNSQTQVILPQNYQLSGAQIYQQNQNVKQQAQIQQGLAAAKLLNQPSISITPLPRQTSSTQQSPSSYNPGNVNMKPGKPPGPGGKNSFVVCEICDSGIKDLEQLRNHMQWIHKVKIHPKMIYNRPPLNCQKCQFRFFTDQGLERHLLGSHGLVTSSMQEAANKGKDSGRCPVCGRVYQWKLLNHVARDHQMALKPAHLSYKCTVCTATFGMYKQFESHVYSAHSVVAKRAMDPKKPPVIPPSSSSQNDALLKPLKINDEITIIPQPVRSSKPPNKPPSSNSSANIVQKGKV